MTYFLAPYNNAYKRFQSGSFAPTKPIRSRAITAPLSSPCSTFGDDVVVQYFHTGKWE
ncbi:MAG: hypothetical protein IIB67_13875 [Proteobacteria bacterium]|nr:hypothetical protein [Pseudomonadota bacterium]